ncbi:MAG: 50S ribosomal protein L29 [Chloroflexi bacterium]|nr:50S ribosomal protein L29 [Chloroflexota bacterium]MDA1002581.1 50S ribosomal protein L29 [Chloroflexota bacterium]MQC27652.1 50S ribosomal protein L29 [Chloroflexota bacterium]
MARDTAELRARTDEDLAGELDESHQALFNLRFQAATGQLADVAQVRNARRRIARIKTLLREREILAIADAAAGAATENEA